MAATLETTGRSPGGGRPVSGADGDARRPGRLARRRQNCRGPARPTRRTIDRMMRRIVPLRRRARGAGSAPAAHAGTYTWRLRAARQREALAWKPIGSPEGAALWRSTAVSGGAPAGGARPHGRRRRPAPGPGYSLKLPTGVTARQVQLSGGHALVGSPIDARVAIGDAGRHDAVGGRPPTAGGTPARRRSRRRGLLRWRVVVPATDAADHRARRRSASSSSALEVTLVESGKPTVTQVGAVATDSRTRKPYTHFRARDASQRRRPPDGRGQGVLEGRAVEREHEPSSSARPSARRSSRATSRRARRA